MIAFSSQHQKHLAMHPRGPRWQGSLRVFALGFVLAAVFFGICQKFDHQWLFLHVPDGMYHAGVGSWMPKPVFIFLLGFLSAMLGGLIFLLPYWGFIEGRSGVRKK